MSIEHFAPPLAKPIVVCGVRFTHASYDEHGDYLYLTRVLRSVPPTATRERAMRCSSARTAASSA